MNMLNRISIISGIASCMLISSCFTNPVTGRKGLNFVDASTINSLAASQYSSFINTAKVDNQSSNGRLVKKVGDKIVIAVEEYLKNINKSNLIKDYKWEFNYVIDKTVNAFCMPGGKVVVYSGIMDVAQTEEGLAVIMGHEIAHAIAQHSGERMSQGLAQQGIGAGLSIALSNKPEQTQNLFNSLYGVGSNIVGILPYSRKHETEADEMGMIFMAFAGYDPAEAVPFWQRMSKLGGSSVELLSTHPSSDTRVKNLQSFLKEANKYYRK